MERSLLNDSGCHSLILSVGKTNDDDNLSETAFTPCKVANSDKAGLPICSSVVSNCKRKRKSICSDSLPSAHVKRSAIVLYGKKDKPQYSNESYGNDEYMISYNNYDNNKDNNNNSMVENSKNDCYVKASTSSSNSDLHSPVSLLSSPNKNNNEEDDEFELLETEYIRIVDEDGNYVFYKKGEYEHSCAWTKCEVSFPTAEGLYDHIIETHVDYIKTVETVPAQVICYFDDCEMYIARGGRERKHMWLAKHIRDRHCADARSYKCLMENCPERFSCPTKLEAHVRNEHILSCNSTKNSPNEKTEKKKDVHSEKKGLHKEAKGKKMETAGGKKKEEDFIEDDAFYNKDDSSSCFGLIPILQPKPRTDPNRFLWMPSYENTILRMYQDLLEMRYDNFIIPNQKVKVGAAHRKSRSVQKRRMYPRRPIAYAGKIDESDDNYFVGLETKMDHQAAQSTKRCSRFSKNEKKVVDGPEIEHVSKPLKMNSKVKDLKSALMCRDFKESLRTKDETSLDDLFPGWNYEEKKENLWANHPNKHFLNKYHQRCEDWNKLSRPFDSHEKDLLDEDECSRGEEEESGSETSEDEREGAEGEEVEDESEAEEVEDDSNAMDEKHDTKQVGYKDDGVYEEYWEEDFEDDDDDEDDEDYIGDDN